MKSRDVILGRVRRNQPAWRELPQVPGFARPLADRFYKWFARNRYKLGCGDHCQLRTPDVEFRDS